MLAKILSSLKGYLTMKSKGIATILVMGIIFGVCVGVAVISDKFLGPDNVIEEDLENIADTAIEAELHLPQGSINIDMSPSTPEKK